MMLRASILIFKLVYCSARCWGDLEAGGDEEAQGGGLEFGELQPGGKGRGWGLGGGGVSRVGMGGKWVGGR